MQKHSRGSKLVAAAMALAMLTGGVNLPLMKDNISTVTASAAAMETGDRILVDLTKNDGRGAAQAAYAHNWIVEGDTSASTTIDGLSITLSASGGSIRTEDNKKLHLYNDKYSRLMCDGVTVDADGGGTLKLTITGLSDGQHSIKTYHAATGNETTSTQSVTVNGTTSTGIKCPNQVYADDDAGISYTTFTGTSVTVEIKPEGSGNAWLNAFEIDGGDPIKGVNHTYPIDQELHLQTDVGLSWSKGSNAASHNVYIGTSYDGVFNATTDSAEFKGNQTGTSYKLDASYTSLNPYYWRVDTVDGSGNVIKGSVYSFYTARLAFPTAEGYGRFARGGRGGTVLHVTNLNDSGEGSLRWALEENTGPRIIVFDVGGVIELQDTLWIRDGYGDVYVAGQTAPGDGITLINHDFGGLGASDVIIRDVRVRVGDSNGSSTGGMGMGSCNHVIVDHCSISWATDEGFSSRLAKNITFQWNIIGESLHDSVHYKDSNRNETECHAFAASIGGNIGSFHHNLLINCTGRNWSLAGGLAQSAQEYEGFLDISNNVVYNWRDRTTDGGINSLNFVNNYYKAGAESNTNLHFVDISDSICPGIQKLYISGNKMVSSSGSTIVDSSEDAWANGRAKITSTAQTQAQGVRTSPMWEDYIELQSADDAYKSVVANVGAGGISDTGWDYIDSRYIKEVTNGTYTYKGSKQSLKGIIDSQNDVGGYPNSSNFAHSNDGATNAANDTDRDGMPDAWETEHKLDPSNPNDGCLDTLSADGYTNLEMYLNELAGDPVEFNSRCISTYEQIEAESFDAQSGIQTEDCSEGGQNIGYVENGDYIKFGRVDFEDGANSVSVRVSSQSGGTIELYADSLDGTPIGTYTVEGTGNWTDWVDVSFNIKKTAGKRALYMKFTGGEGYLVNVNHFVFSKEKLPMNGKLITGLYLNDEENAADWSIQYGVTSGSTFFGDRDVTYKTIPTYLEGAEYLVTAADSKAYANDLGVFTAGANISVYIALDKRVDPAPAWLSTWENTGESLINSKDVEFALYKREVKAGETVTLGTNGQSASCVNYVVLATASDGGTLIGDVNVDGKFSTLDVVMLQKWLLGSSDLTDWTAGDLCEDGVINGFDLAFMKRMLLQQ